MTAAEKLANLTEALKAGRTVYVQTHTRATKITQKNFAAFEAAGRPLLKADSKSLYMSVGKRYDCIDFCKITVA